MIEGSLSDVSLAGLLQFLATEVDKCFSVRITRGGQRGEINICNGDLMQANFGLLEGDDALCEYLSWKEGHFIIERLPTLAKNSVKRNLSVLSLHPGNTFADHCLYLIESNVGLNTELIASDTFGTQEWHQALRTQPLEKHDFAIIGWVSDGRTMRHAMREFTLNITEATASLYRLVFTKSVVAVRPTFTPPALFDVMESLATQLELEEAQAAVTSAASTTEVAKETAKPKGEALPIDLGGRVKAPDGDQISGNLTVSRAEKTEAAQTAVKTEAGEKKTDVAVEKKESSDAAAPDSAPDTMPANPFNIRRTDPLPLVTIDIERLFQSTFTLTQFGELALTNQSLDSFLRQVLSAVESGKSFIVTVNESTRPHPSTLATFRYCFDRGYVSQPDPVLIVTCDLLLGRVELEQYLLQRRRITGDELQTLVRMSTSEGRALPDLLVANGFLTEGDLERWTAEKGRFAART